MKVCKFLAVLLVLGLLMGGCGGETVAESTGGPESTAPASDDVPETTAADPTQETGAAVPITDEEMFTDRDLRTAYGKAAEIILRGNSADCDSDAVVIDGTRVTITGEGTYVISGTLDNGQIIVNADEKDKPQLVFNGMSVTSETSAALYILEADKVVVTLAEGTENTLVNGGGFEPTDDNNIDGAIFSKQDLTFNGTGSLTVTSPAGHGIVCKDDLVFTGGSYTVSAASHALDANDSVRCMAVSMNLIAGKDGIHVENSDDATKGFLYIAGGNFDIEAEGDGIGVGAYGQILDGTFRILAGGGYENGTAASSGNYGNFMGGGRGGFGGPGGMMPPGQQNSQTESEDSTSMKGVKTAGELVITGGSFVIDSADDGLHSDTSLTITGGSFEIASGDDGIHAEETLTIAAGEINISTCYEGLEAQHVRVSGGKIRLTAMDDGINAAGGTDASGMGGRDNGGFGPGGPMGGMGGSSDGSIIISGGDIYINSSGDGIDANGYLEITGGYTIIVGPTMGDTATLDYDTTGVISGGTFIGTGASGMAQTFSDSENQGVIAVSVGNQSAGTKIVLKDSQGKELITHTPELDFAVVILSSPEMVKGENYTIYVGEASGEFEAK